MQNLHSISVLLSIAAGGAVGSLLRYALSHLISLVTGTGFPAPIMLINIIGSFAMGLVVAILSLKINEAPLLKLFLTVGLLGGFTTFSAFSLDVITLMENGDFTNAFIYVFGSVVFSVLAIFAGLSLGRFLL